MTLRTLASLRPSTVAATGLLPQVDGPVRQPSSEVSKSRLRTGYTRWVDGTGTLAEMGLRS